MKVSQEMANTSVRRSMWESKSEETRELRHSGGLRHKAFQRH